MEKNNKYLYFICFVASIGGLMFGFDTAIIAGAIPFIQPYFKWNELQLGWGVSSLLAGAIIGAFGSGFLTDKFGRKKILIIVALFFALSCTLTALASTSITFILARLIGGLAVGAVSVLSPMYIAEVSPPNKRGMLVAFYQFSIVLGVISSYSLNYSLHDVYNNWRWMFATGVFPSLLFFIGLFFIPESPRWLYLAGHKEKSLRILERIGGKDLAKNEIREISESIRESSKKIYLKKLFEPSYRKVLTIGIILAILVQVTGINAVTDYAPKILIEAGTGIKNALLRTFLIGIVNVIFTIVAILVIDKIGRRKLYLIGSIGMAVTLGMIALSFYLNLNALFTLVCMMLYIASFASCIGPVFWTLTSEIFPNKIRGIAISLISFTQWIFNFLVVFARNKRDIIRAD